MDAAAAAQQSATSIDPTAIQKLKGHGDDPASRRAIAAQFASFLTQGLMRQADGSALPMADGVGADTVSSMFANVMSQVASSSPQLGLADVLLNAMPGKSATPDAATAQSSAATASTPSAAASAPSTAPASAVGPGLSLLQYRNGVRAFMSGGRPPPPTTAPLPAPAVAGGVPAQAAPAPTQPAAPTISGSAPAASTSSSAAPASPDTTTSGARQSSNADARARFVEKLAPSLRAAAQQLGVSPRVLLAQAALETGWGSSMPGNNIFGVKAGANWTGDTISASTVEDTASGPTRQTDRFRAYPSLEAAVADYAKLIANNSRYAGARDVGDNAAAYGAALGHGGYATDPAYATKIAAIASSATMSVALGNAPAATPSLYADRGTQGSRA
jgi:flagellar protein FlgJ